MENQNKTIATTNGQQVQGTKAVSQFLNQPNVLDKFKNLLGEKAQGFITSVITAVNSNDLLKNATSESVYSAALMAATLDLPINQNLGFAYIIPFNNRKANRQEAQFQLGVKGFVQLAQRSGQFKSIYTSEIYEGQIINENPLDGYEFDFKVKSSKIVGYAAKFKLVNGYEATLYMTIDQLKQHSNLYSQTAKKGYGLWVDNFDAMAKKTVLKLLLSKYAPLSIEMQKAQIADQGILRNPDNLEIVDYVDNTPLTINEVDTEKEINRLVEYINHENTGFDDLDSIDTELLFKYNLVDLVETRKQEIAEATKKEKKV